MGCCDNKPDRASKHSREMLTTAEAVLKQRKPTVESDGSLLFEALAPVMKGYIHDPTDLRRLKPDKAQCTERISMPYLQQDGTYVLFNQCNHVDCEMRGQTVDEEICKDCPLRKLPRKPTRLEE